MSLWTWRGLRRPLFIPATSRTSPSRIRALAGDTVRPSLVADRLLAFIDKRVTGEKRVLALMTTRTPTVGAASPGSLPAQASHDGENTTRWT